MSLGRNVAPVRHHILWRLMVRVKDQRKAEGRIQKVRETLGVELEVRKCEPYWKIPDLWECAFKTPPTNDSIPQVVFDCLAMAQKLGKGWIISGPCTHEGALTLFDGILDARMSGRACIPGLEWGWFGISPTDGGFRGS